VEGNQKFGCIIGHTTGSPRTITETYETLLPEHDISLLTATKFFQCLSHTAVLNVSSFLGIRGIVMATSAACASGLQAVGTAYDLIRLGRQDVLLCGGSEELHPTVTGSFDILYATSCGYNDCPQRTPRPFDRDRDGLVCGEGAGILVLEDFERAVARGANIHGEVLGYHTCGNGSHVSQSTEDGVIMCVKGALADAGLAAAQIDYINAHATGTPQGDAAEAAALKTLFGEPGTPVSGLKGYLSHTLGASGAIELILSLVMMRDGVVYPTLNLDHIAPDCAGINHVTERSAMRIDRFLKNSFAFGGVNAALVCGRAP
jgi:3-oxoacyl-[acyl-carrier-protein] synthase II